MLLRSELKNFPQFFDSEQKILSQLFLCKSKKEIIAQSGIDVENEEFLKGVVNSLETRSLTCNNSAIERDVFQECIKRYLAFEIFDCPFHKPNSHDLLKEISSKTKKISKPAKENSFEARIKKIRKRHFCKYQTFNLSQKMDLTDLGDQVWKVKFSSNAEYVLTATKKFTLSCFKTK
jgi:hypothetical protein